MAAGIISANLPTMLPALNIFLRKIGVRTESGTLRSGSSFFRSTNKGDKSQQSRPDTVSDGTAKSAHSAFYRLHDDNDSQYARSNIETPTEGKLRPDAKSYQYTVKSLPPEERDETSSDEIPLHAIRVEKDTVVRG